MLPSFVKLCSRHTRRRLFDGRIATGHLSSSPSDFAAAARRVRPCKHCCTSTVREFNSETIPEPPTVCSSKKRLVVKWQDKEVSSSYHSQWLMRHCHCQKCVEKSSGQRTATTLSFHDDYSIEEVQIAIMGGERRIIEVRMREDPGHVLQFPTSFLYENAYDPPLRDCLLNKEPPPLAEPIPTMSYCDLITGEDEVVHQWLSALAEDGVVLLKGAPIKAGTVIDAAELIAHVQETLYGKTFDVMSQEDAINIAYTSSALEPHQDLVYYQSPPGLQLLHCLKFDDSVVGGESTLVDGFEVARILRRAHPEDFRILSTVPATFQKVHYRREHPAHFVYKKPHISVNPKGEVIGILWAPPFEGPLHTAPELIQPYYRAYSRLSRLISHSKHMVKFRLQPGEILSFNNLRILHGRCGFSMNGGMRRLQGLYVNIDEFRSKLQYLSRKLGKHVTKYHIGNGDAA